MGDCLEFYGELQRGRRWRGTTRQKLDVRAAMAQDRVI
jgi:hypothetical protein